MRRARARERRRGRRRLTLAASNQRVAWSDDDPTTRRSAAREGLRPRHRHDELMTNAGLARARATPRRWWPSSRAPTAWSYASPTPTTASRRRRRRSARCCARAWARASCTRLVATLVLFFAVGVRLARPKPAAPPRRRAFAEHVEAVGALYARTRSAPHALAAYARFADERLRARMPRGTSDVARSWRRARGCRSRRPAPLDARGAGQGWRAAAGRRAGRAPGAQHGVLHAGARRMSAGD